MRNVSHNLKKGGIFITTFMDGQEVHKLLETSKTPGKVEGRKLDNKIPVWAILKEYSNFEDGHYYGKMIKVYLENTNKLIPEFLVNFDTLIEKANTYGLKLKSSALFSENHKQLLAKVPLDPTKRRKLDEAVLNLDKDPIQKQFSFLNRWAVFEMI
jgi:hypothetical protein